MPLSAFANFKCSSRLNNMRHASFCILFGLITSVFLILLRKDPDKKLIKTMQMFFEVEGISLFDTAGP